MKVEIISQPYDEYGSSKQLGTILISLLNNDPTYDKIWLVSAFANQRAISYLLPSVHNAISNGSEVSIVVGIDHKGTSLEALQSILDLGSDAKVVHNNRPGHTFHPKVYLFEKDGHQADLFVGSNNLTLGGLYTNYEVATHIIFDLPKEQQEYERMKLSLDRIFNPPDAIVRTLNENLIANLEARGEIVSEKERQETTKLISSPKSFDDKKTIPTSPFGNEIVGRPSSIVQKPKVYVPTTDTFITRGDLLWEKSNLPASDVQQSSQSTNPTGGLRLTQAKWRVDNEVIDQTTYFRYDLFGQFEWSTGVHPPIKRETVVINFDVHILEFSYGIHEIIISHKPSGEAGQGNYTTILHWGELADTIKTLNLIGRTFRLYAPVDNSEIFVIEII